MKAHVVIKDLRASAAPNLKQIALTPEQMKRVVGGRSVVVKVDNSGTGTVDDWEINTAIFEGRIKGSYL